MIIVEKNAGPKIPYEVTGAKIIFDDDLMLNLAKRQGDEPVHLFICLNTAQALIIGMEDILVRSSGRLAVRREKIPCDYYYMLRGDMDYLNSFRGEYMSQYSWAEGTLGRLIFTH